MPGSHWRLILNGKSAEDEVLREVIAQRRERGDTVEVRVTWEAGDADRYVREAIGEGVATLVAAGGDGTLSEIAAAMARHTQSAEELPSLALIPLGTANDFATAAGIPADIAQAFDVLAQPARAIDLLRIEADDGEHWCINLASGGFGTEITVETDEGLKKVLGGLAYLITGIARLGSIEPIPARVTGPEFSWRGEFIALGIGNGRQAGGGQVLCPEARIDDGLLDLTVIPPLAGEVGATVGTAITKGREAALERVATRARLARIELRAEQPLRLNLDGEPLESRRFTVECVAARLRMHLPVDCPLLG